jgi:anti-sigma B factor antagonist
MVVDIAEQELSPGVTAISFTGRLILGNRLGEVEHAIREKIKQGSRKLVLDFSGLNYMDSAGVGVLAMCVGIMEREGGKLLVAGATGHVEQLLELTHLNRLVGMYPDAASARSALPE